jgi:3',5'-cyclic AMP phosphodiesterase CpdA
VRFANSPSAQGTKYSMTIDPKLSRRVFVHGAAVFSALTKLGCTASARPAHAAATEADSRNALAFDTFACPALPTAYVLHPAGGDAVMDRTTRALQLAGFAIASLPLDRSPLELRGLIAIPSFISHLPGYAEYMRRYAGDLASFVDAANVLLQLPQTAESEPAPPFVPAGYGLRREDRSIGGVELESGEHALMRNVKAEDGLVQWREPDPSTPVFIEPEAFQVLLGDPEDGAGLLLETAYGQGRFVLSALALDRESGEQAEREFAVTVLANLFEYVSSVCNRTVGAVSLSPSGPSTAFTEGSSMLAVLPDTQFYALRYPGLFLAQTGWIRSQAVTRDIRYVLHLGDIVHNNTKPEWERASDAMGQLHGAVPYALAPGNHDYGPGGNASTRETRLNDHFSFELAAGTPGFGGAHRRGALDNSYHLFSIQGRDFITIALEWGPRDEVIEWANQVMAAHPDREGILVTHAYLNNNDRRYDHTDTEHPQRFNPHDYSTPGGVNDGEELWQKLVRRHRFAMTFNGHVLDDGCGYLASVTDHGNVCHQMLSNYQMRDQGGEAYMRLLEFMPDGRSVAVFTYSPLYDRFLDVADQNFTIVLD